MVGFRGNPQGYAGIAGADLENAPSGPVPFTSPFGLPVTRMQLWHAGGTQPGGNNDGVPGTGVQRASGNPDRASVPTYLNRSPYGGQNATHVEGNPRGQLPYGNNQNPENFVSGLPQFGSPRVTNYQQETGKYFAPTGGANDGQIANDRHQIMKVGYENSGRDSGFTDPPVQGPARPSLWMVQRTISYQSGSDASLTQDDLNRDYSRAQTVQSSRDGIGWIANPMAGPMLNTTAKQYTGAESPNPYVGEQGTGWSPVYGGVPGLYQPYGSYGGVTNGPVQGIQSPVEQGAQGDGPRKVWAGPPHGLHSPTLPSYSQTLGRYMAVPQMSLPRVDRPSNSPIAGQSYNQTVQPQGQTGTAVAGTGPSGPVFNQRVRGNGWRGRGQG